MGENEKGRKSAALHRICIVKTFRIVKLRTLNQIGKRAAVPPSNLLRLYLAIRLRSPFFF